MQTAAQCSGSGQCYDDCATTLGSHLIQGVLDLPTLAQVQRDHIRVLAKRARSIDPLSASASVRTTAAECSPANSKHRDAQLEIGVAVLPDDLSMITAHVARYTAWGTSVATSSRNEENGSLRTD